MSCAHWPNLLILGTVKKQLVLINCTYNVQAPNLFKLQNIPDPDPELLPSLSVNG